MIKENDELTLFISYLQNERHYSSKTIASYKTDLLEVEKFLKENGLKFKDIKTLNVYVMLFDNSNKIIK